MEPVAANMGVVPPAAGFLEGLREITQREGALLIFDEVITGFRLAYGGAQGVYGIRSGPHGDGENYWRRFAGGGLRRASGDIMERVAPLGPVYQAGTLSGNPLAMRAGLATLPKLEAPGFYEGVNRKTNRLAEGLRAALREAGVCGPSERGGFVADTIFLRAAGA